MDKNETMMKLIKVMTGLAIIPLAFVIMVIFHDRTADKSDYNYEQFSASQYSHGFFNGPDVGSAAEDFTLLDTQGVKHSLSDYRGSYLVLETGSLTCPQYISRIEPMRSVLEDHPDVTFLTIYVREAHPGSLIGSHSSQQEQSTLASRLLTEEPESRTVLVDELTGSVHQSYGAWPNMVYIVSPEGNIAFRGMWNNPEVVSEVLTRLKTNRPVGELATGLTPKFDDTGRVLDRAGGHAKSDFVLGVVASAFGYASTGVN